MKNTDVKVDIKDLRTLKVYQKSMKFTKDIFTLTKRFPKDEKYRLVDQMERASYSIPSNLAEGVGQEYLAKTLSFCNNAFGSANEMRCFIELSNFQGYITDEEMRDLQNQLDEICKMLIGYMKMIKRNMKEKKSK